MIIYLILWMLLLHWVADFIFQDEKWALNKSKSLSALLQHVFTYSVIITLGMFPFLSLFNTVVFWASAFLFHFIVDFFTSKLVGYKFSKKEFGSPIPNLGAFTIIGLDQFIHTLILIKTLMILQ